MWTVMNAYVTMHNMIIESEREHPVVDLEPYHCQGPLATIDHQVPTAFTAFIAMRQEIRDGNTHSQLQDDWFPAKKNCKTIGRVFVEPQRKHRLVFLSSIYLDFKLCIICMYKLCFK
jgi:hypothetical protein